MGAAPWLHGVMLRDFRVKTGEGRACRKACSATASEPRSGKLPSAANSGDVVLGAGLGDRAKPSVYCPPSGVDVCAGFLGAVVATGLEKPTRGLSSGSVTA